MSNESTTKPCPFCAEQIQATAVKCKHCGERLDQEQASKLFAPYEQWLAQNYPAYRIVSRDADARQLVLNKEHGAFNVGVFILLILLWVLPGIIYALATMTNKKVISVTLRFRDDGDAEVVGNSGFGFLAQKYNAHRGLPSAAEPAEKEAVRKSSKKLYWILAAVTVVCMIAVMASI